MRWLVSLLLLFAFVTAPAEGASPAAKRRAVALAQQRFHGPGSKGFLSTCTGDFAATNGVLQSNSFSTTPWLLGGQTSAAPTITSTTATAPDSTSTATTLSIPIVSAVNAYSLLYQRVTNQPGGVGYTDQIWLQNTTPANGTAYLTLGPQPPDATSQSVAVPNDGAWHQVSITYPGSTYTSAPYFEIGVDKRATETSSTGTMIVNVWHAQGTYGPGVQTYIPTTTAAVQGTKYTLPCPAGVAFRDFSTLTYTGSPITSPNVSQPWRSSGVSTPRISTTAYVGGKYYGLMAATDSVGGNDWFSFGLMQSTGPFDWTEAAGVTNPLIIAPGADNTAHTAGTGTFLKSYLLHPEFGPNGCTISGTFYTYCVYFSGNSAANGGGSAAVFMAYSNTVTGPYTITTTPIIGSGAIGGAPQPSLPSIVNDGAGNYVMFTSVQGNNGKYTVTWTSPAITGGVTWTFHDLALLPVLTTDWDAATFGRIDNYVTKNQCGFYEYFFTTQFVTGQRLGYAVSNSPYGPWFMYQGSLFPQNAPIYGGVPYLGDPTILFRDRKLYLLADTSDGSTQAHGVAASMADGCAR